MIKEAAALWMNKITDDEDRAELNKIAENGELLNERFGSDLQFGTGGLRGIVGMGTNCMNVYTVSRASRGIAAYMSVHGMKHVAISYDSRKKSELFAQTAARIFAYRGISVVIARELMPTPFLSFLTRKEKCGIGIMITASHNPAAYNGYKVYNGKGGQITDRMAEEIARYIEREDYFGQEFESFESYVIRGIVRYAPENAEDLYLDGIREIVGKTNLNGLKVAYTALNGTGYRLVPKLLKHAGAEVFLTEPQCVPDENFATCPYPNPEKKEALTLGVRTAEENACDILIATDPDADRVGIAVRCGGKYERLTGNEVGLLLERYLLEDRKRRGEDCSRFLIIKTIVTTSLAEKIAAEYGAGVINVLTGFKYIGEQIGLLEEKGETDRFLLGFEESYGYLLGSQVRDKDALVASLAICRMAAEYKERGVNLKDEIGAVYQKYGSLTNTLLTYSFYGMKGKSTMRELINKFRESPNEELCGKKVLSRKDYLNDRSTGLPKSDVLYFDFGNSENMIIRPSGTEPVLKIYLSLRENAERFKNYFDSILVPEI